VVSEPVGGHLLSLHRLWTSGRFALLANSGKANNGATFNACETALCRWSCRTNGRNTSCTSGFRARPERHLSQPQLRKKPKRRSTSRRSRPPGGSQARRDGRLEEGRYRHGDRPTSESREHNWDGGDRRNYDDRRDGAEGRQPTFSYR